MLRATELGERRGSRWLFRPACRAGHSPRDCQLGLSAGDLSRGAAELAALAGTLGSFAKVATKTLPKLAGLRVSESTVERTTERVGDHIGERLSAGDTLNPRIGTFGGFTGYDHRSADGRCRTFWVPTGTKVEDVVLVGRVEVIDHQPAGMFPGFVELRFEDGRVPPR